jgi:murein DD-endopeptidase MepM/ murein hydrolase activator NlpD
MLAPVPGGVLTRQDNPDTPEDERLHDGNARDCGVRGNVLGWPVTSLFEGKVVTADWYPKGAKRGAGYGLAVRIEGRIRISKSRVLRARVAWPLVLDGVEDGELDVRVLYGHHHELWVQEGETVKALQPLGGMGNTGLSHGVHVHVNARLLQVPDLPACFVDPLPLFVYARALRSLRAP